MNADATHIALREAHYETCRVLLPKRYLSDPDVLNSPEETRKVQAEWDVYFRCMNEGLAKYPYTADELAKRALAPGPESSS